jgi:aryl-alcohol dehydrogenase-like predicted oxidoreductase
MLSPASTYQFTPDLRICRLLNGMWQVSGGHGRIEPEAAITEMMAYHDAGFTTWDLADHYGPAEDFIGKLRQRLVARSGPEALGQMQAFTKWVPSPGPMTRPVVERAVDVSRRRMDTETLDLLQFHWWEYRDLRYLDALEQLAELRAAGKIRHLGLTNFDTRRLEIMVERGLPIVSNQVQYSLVDRRPEVARASDGEPAQVQADDRRLGGVGVVSGAIAGGRAGGGAARGEHRQRGGACDLGSASRSRCYRRHAARCGRAHG